MLLRSSCLIFALLAAGCAAKAPAPPPVPSASAIPAAPPRGEPGQYLNMPAAALQAAFGKPAFVRKDGATEMWRYDNTNCHAFFFLYGAGTQRQVRHIETVPQGKGIAADPACLNALKKTP